MADFVFTDTGQTEFTLDSTFDRLFDDSLTDVNNTCAWGDYHNTTARKKESVTSLMNQTVNGGKNTIIKKDDVVCMYIQGMILNNSYIWNGAITGKIDDSKSWCASEQFYIDNKAYIQSLGCNSWIVKCHTDNNIDSFFTTVSNAGRTQGTFSRTAVDNTCTLKWVY
tara:strand:- start:163 stop:663 length:501 start_codon:yes stop_codon:yes gene_type:complete